MKLRTAALGAALMVAAAGAAAILWAGHALTKPAPLGTGPAPPAARSVELPGPGAARLSAWFMRGAPGRGGVLLLHPLRSSKRAMLARAEFLHRAGHSVLLLDLPAHGESRGDRIGFGALEAPAVDAAVRWLERELPAEPLAAIGVSLGAAAIVLSQSHVAFCAVVLESLYPTLESALANRLRIRFGTIGPLLSPLLEAQIEPRLGVSTQALRPIARVGALRARVLLIHGSEDNHTSLHEAQRVFAAISAPKEMYTVRGAAHVDLHAYAGARYEQRVIELLKHCM